MYLWCTLWAIAPFLRIASTQTFESLTGLELIGSHFGIPFFNTSFDYVVIGGGTAGLAVATRLAQNSSFSVAVIEAGGLASLENGNLSSIPADNAYWVGKHPSLRNTIIDWSTWTEPMPGFGGNNMLYSAGKTLGGGSSRNSLTYHRPTKGSFNKWAEAVGDESWNWDAVFPFFKRSVTFQPPNDSIRPYNATARYKNDDSSIEGGPLKVSYPNHANAFSSWMEKAFQELGFNDTAGNIGGDLLGYSYTGNTLDRESQTRSSSETAFLRTALWTTDNLNVYTKTTAKRIVFDGKAATGVVVSTEGIEYQIAASKEIVLSAGALRSPQLLMVSGVGPEAKLSELGIQLVANRPGVGQGLQDHVIFGASYEVNLETHTSMANPVFAAAQQQAYRQNRTGMLTNSATDFLGWEKLPDKYRINLPNSTRAALEKFPSDWPDLEIVAADAYGGTFDDFLSGSPADGKNYASIAVGLQSVFSRGNVTIKSVDTSDQPVVNPNLLGDPRDIEIAVESYKRIREIAASKAMKEIIIGTEAFPGANITSDAAIRELLRKSSNSIYHASCTCAMGRRDDDMSVVDSEGKVIGVERLRIADASVFPFLPPGHPQSVVYAVAEKIVDNIIHSK